MQHAITRLREERRVLLDVYRHLLADHDLQLAERAQLLAQTRSELADVDAALGLLTGEVQIPSAVGAYR